MIEIIHQFQQLRLYHESIAFVAKYHILFIDSLNENLIFIHQLSIFNEITFFLAPTQNIIAKSRIHTYTLTDQPFKLQAKEKKKMNGEQEKESVKRRKTRI